VKFLLVEFWHSHIYAEPFLQRLRELGHEVHAFREMDFFAPREGPVHRLSSLSARVQNKFRVGPRLRRLNVELRKAVEQLRPDVLFVFRGSHVTPETLDVASRAGSYVIGWNNDDPFSARYPAYVWRHFRRGISHYQHLFAYRDTNVRDFLREGCPRVSLLRSFYLRELNHPIDTSKGTPYACDVSFIGHWEPDGREQYVDALMKEPSIDFRLWGTLWQQAPIATRLKQRFGQIAPVYKDAYNLAINSSKISLVFLSALNNDSYTRRCFEIPAAGTFMLAQYTPDIASLFKEGEEAEYFRSIDEMLDKVRHYLRNDEARRRIARAGHARLLRDGHEAIDRAKQVVVTISAELGVSREVTHPHKSGAFPPSSPLSTLREVS
jgi:spore maturation protein CgeB